MADREDDVEVFACGQMNQCGIREIHETAGVLGHESLNLRQFLVRNVEDGVYGWHLAAERKAELEEEARREGSPLSSLVERVTDDWLAEHNSVA